MVRHWFRYGVYRDKLDTIFALVKSILGVSSSEILVLRIIIVIDECFPDMCGKMNLSENIEINFLG